MSTIPEDILDDQGVNHSGPGEYNTEKLTLPTGRAFVRHA